ncbi:head-tail connector protein [Staphylococcus intermedius]|uniref:head-tail connector protein n=1 Tax=Staphylococcus intermedius TaxID=1285 RepID=UPI000BBBBEC8|nr:head-tail connector protein [Staphylococcus intermedius]PCF86391.1 phage head-tail adapter protein [Staphylococcus intermedius]
MDVESIKTWLRVDYRFEDTLIKDIIESAKSELTLSGVPEYHEGEIGYPLYCTAIKYIIARDYESRGYSNDQSRTKMFNEKGLQKMILKLKKW